MDDTFFGDEVLALKTELIPGITFSSLLMGKCITPGRLVALLDVMKELHSYRGRLSDKPGDSLIYENYSPKLQKRFKEHESIYNELDGHTTFYYEMIVERLAIYKEGDHVFTNVILSKIIQPK